jgi:hypothetical protein
MKDQQKIIKDDINFLEYPTWVVSKKKKITVWTIKKPQGKYEIISPMGIPKHFDKIVLYSLLYRLYKEKELESYLLITNRYEIAKSVLTGNHFGKNVYSRIMGALRKWTSLYIDFEGVFYEGNGYTTRLFHIIDEVTLKKESGELSIKFNESYVKQLKETKFYKLIDFEQYKKLHKTSSARLYEILVKNYKERNEWAINIQLLAEKLTFEKRERAQSYYPSDVLRYLKPSISEINKKTDLEIGFSYNKDTGACVFKKLKKQKATFVAAIKDESKSKKLELNNQKKIDACIEYFNSLGESEQQNIRNKAAHDSFLVVFKTEEEKIYGYMTNNKLWHPAENN